MKLARFLRNRLRAPAPATVADDGGAPEWKLDRDRRYRTPTDLSVTPLWRAGGADRGIGVLVETEANGSCRTLFSEAGFERVGQVWERRLDPLPQLPPHIDLIG